MRVTNLYNYFVWLRKKNRVKQYRAKFIYSIFCIIRANALKSISHTYKSAASKFPLQSRLRLERVTTLRLI